MQATGRLLSARAWRSLRWDELAIVVACLITLAATVCSYVMWRAARRVNVAADAVSLTDIGWRLADIEAGRTTLSSQENGVRVAGLAAAQLPPDWTHRDLDRALRLAYNVALA